MSQLRSNIEWEQWGAEDPLFGAVNWPGKEKGSVTAWTDQEFYALGKSDWVDFLGQWQHYGITKDSCLEIGCGTGRFTKQLSLIFTQLVAVDISADMITYAKARMETENVEFFLSDGVRLPQPDCSVTAVFSAYVLQHLDNIEIGLTYFREMYRVLAIGGTLMVQLPLYQWPTSEHSTFTKILETLYGARHRISDLLAEARRVKGERTMRDTIYPMRRLRDGLTAAGYGRIEFRLFPARSDGSLQSFVLATKSGSESPFHTSALSKY
jgi:SAM-dependent methyltransferase